MRSVNFLWFFFSNWLMPFWNPLLIICHAANLWWNRHFADWIFISHGMLWHTEALPKPRRIDVHIILAICRMARPHFVAFCLVALCEGTLTCWASDAIRCRLCFKRVHLILYSPCSPLTRPWITIVADGMTGEGELQRNSGEGVLHREIISISMYLKF